MIRTMGLLLLAIALIANGRFVAAEPLEPLRGRPINYDDRYSKVEKKLAGLASLEVIEVPLSEVLTSLGKQHSLEIHLQRLSIQQAGVDPDVPITRHLKGMTLRSTLWIILRDLELTYLVRDEVLVICPINDAKRGDNMMACVYPVADLIGESHDKHAEYQSLVKAVQVALRQDVWDAADDKITACPSAGELIVRAPFGVHAEIEGMFKVMREVRDMQKNVESVKK